MAARRITISCPRCREQFKDITVDEAERILFHGCPACRQPGGRRTASPGAKPSPSPQPPVEPAGA